MNNTLKLIFDKQQVDKFITNTELSEDELLMNVKTFSFDTEAELNAFKKGVYEGVGWQECFVIDGVLQGK